MKTVGMIVEYNPLHNGHVLHYKRSKAITDAECAVAVMSGHFLQRGEPALIGKRSRAEMALHMGADLVIELPVAYAVQPAEWFAYGAVSLLHATGVVDSLCFGSEQGSLSSLRPLAAQLAREDSGLKVEISKQLSSGISFPAAFAAAAGHVQGVSPQDAEEISLLLSRPNNSLGLHYLIALERLQSRIEPYTIPRDTAQYHDPLPAGPSIASATSIRRLILENGLGAAAPYVPDYTLHILQKAFTQGNGPFTWESFRHPLFHLLHTLNTHQLERLLEVGEGLEHRIKKILPRLNSFSVEELLTILKTKRYTRTRLQRMLMHILLHHSKEQLSRTELVRGPGYIRILGFSEKGRLLLKEMKRTATLPVVTRAAALNHPQLDLDLQASAVYAAASGQPQMSLMYEDYRLPPVKI
ncbi:nucleotidyltransferase [Paenibacillus lemnae]|uniref:tRNA(Met) cytidine acetate ligase n=1 Tax=Paenibacillus lemnae TaxID=1330551 RepID=A0A848M8G8_PAELE|nr:nucleotidyltransferase [Paenibacillus lemnae]